MNKFKSTEKDKAFEDFRNELHPLTRKSKWLDFGTASKAKTATNHTLEFDYKGYTCKVELK